MNWWFYRLRLRWRMWRHTGVYLNKRVDIENTLLRAKDGLTAEECRALAYKLGTIP